MAVSLQSLIDDIRIMSGLRQNQFNTNAQIIGFLNDARQELSDTIMKANEHHLMTPFEFTLLGGSGDGNDTIELPADFIQGHSIDGNVQAGNPDEEYPILPLPNWLQRHNYRGAARPRYFFRGRSLVMYPASRAAGTYRLWYTPIVVPMALPITVEFEVGSLDTGSVPPVGLLAGAGSWQLANAAFNDQIPEDESVILNLTFEGMNAGFSGAYPIVEIGLASEGYGSPSASCDNLTSVAGIVYPLVGDGNYTYQPIGTSSELEQTLEPYAQILKMASSITIRNGRDQDVADLTRKMEQAIQRMQSTITNRTEEPSQPPLTRDGGTWDDGCSDIEWSRG